MNIERIKYRDWTEAYRCTVGPAELVVVTAIGPRILSLRLDGGVNVLFEDDTQFGVGAWRLYGGHRFMTAPESAATYLPDNTPCEAQVSNGRLRITQLPDARGLQKTLVIASGPQAPGFEIIHGLVNRSRRAWFGAPWACTCVKPEGPVMIPRPAPLNPRQDGLASSPPAGLNAQQIPLAPSPRRRGARCAPRLGKRSAPQELGTPVGSVNIVTHPDGARYWSLAGGNYARPTSPQWGWNAGHFVIQPPLVKGKVGLLSSEGCLTLVRPELTFLIRAVGVESHLTYPHGGCNVEVYTSTHYLEMETLGPLTTLASGQQLTHREWWQLMHPALSPAEFLVAHQAPVRQPLRSPPRPSAHE
jgi:hypothetical protein